MDAQTWRQAGRRKARLRKILLADCLCLALAQCLTGELMITDHRECGKVAKERLCRLRLVR